MIKVFKNKAVREKSNKLNLGCGKHILPGFINLDFINALGVDVVHDLNKFPYPFEDNTFDHIKAINIIEHLKDPEKVIRELNRIAKPNATMEIVVPHYSSHIAWYDMTHVRPFSLKSLEVYNVDSKDDFSTLLNTDTKIRFRVETTPLMFFGWRLLGLKHLAKRFPYFYESFLTFIFQIGGIKWDIKVIK